jgi:hypothetical protein
VVGVIDDGSHALDTRARTNSEKAWAAAIAAQVKASGAARALLLVSHTDARNEAWPRSARFAGYDPMPLHLDGEVLSLEIGASPTPGIDAPTVRLYVESTDGFAGQVALRTLTRPGLDLAAATVTGGVQAAFFKSSDPETEAVLSSTLTREEKISRLAQVYEREFLAEAGAQRTRSSPGVTDRIRSDARKLAMRVVDLGDQRAAPLSPSGLPQFPVENLPPDIPEPVTELPEFKTVNPPSN